MKKGGLGRGLSALIPEKDLSQESLIDTTSLHQATRVKIEQISTNKYQPRQEFDSEKMDELIASVKEKGVIQPVLVRKVPEGYELICGERRMRAAQAAGLEEIPAVVRDISDVESLEFSLIENIQRQGLNPIERACGYKRLMDEFGLVQDELAAVLSKDRSSVANTLRLLKLPQVIQSHITHGKITMGHGLAILSLPSSRLQIEACESIIKRNLSVREIEAAVKKRKPAIKGVTKKSPQIIEIEEELQRVMATQVKIKAGRKKGKIEIEYYSPQDLTRIVDILVSSLRG
ncbi:MAG: ParB/RepB/Spo0J family partition protein [Candidatus Omnitrophota bacterium]|nr:ParB/RepB/Spo0J family partition protein [Candidatus Omnitrophota bacterium]